MGPDRQFEKPRGGHISEDNPSGEGAQLQPSRSCKLQHRPGAVLRLAFLELGSQFHLISPIWALYRPNSDDTGNIAPRTCNNYLKKVATLIKFDVATSGVAA